MGKEGASFSFTFFGFFLFTNIMIKKNTTTVYFFLSFGPGALRRSDEDMGFRKKCPQIGKASFGVGRREKKKGGISVCFFKNKNFNSVYIYFFQPVCGFYHTSLWGIQYHFLSSPYYRSLLACELVVVRMIMRMTEGLMSVTLPAIHSVYPASSPHLQLTVL